MGGKHIIFIPGKNLKPPAEQHKNLLWRTLLEGVNRAEPHVKNDLINHENDFKLIAWNYLYYHAYKDISLDLPWIDTLLNTHGPTEDDIQEASSPHLKINRIFYSIIDYLPYLLKLLPAVVQSTAEETKRYFQNKDNIACEVRELVKKELRPILERNEKVLLIGHSMGSIIAYDSLWELSHLENLSARVDTFLTLGSPLGMKYVRKRLVGNKYEGKKKYPTIINKWINIASTGDVTALNRNFSHVFSDMQRLKLINTIEDHVEGIYNFFHNEKGLNCHRSYGYLVNPAVGKVIADWWELD